MKFLINARRWLAWSVICPELKAEVKGLSEQLQQSQRVLAMKDVHIGNLQTAYESAKDDLERMYSGGKAKGEMGRPLDGVGRLIF